MAIRKCTCKNEYMDKKYGKGMRVHTPTMLNGGTRGAPKTFRCCVCKKEH